MTPLFTLRYRAQVRGVNGWVDFTLFGRRKDAERQLEDLAGHWQLPTRLIEVLGLAGVPEKESSE